MKTVTKSIFMGLLILMPHVLEAQKPFYHNVGDTLESLDTIYWRPEWYDKYVRLDTITAQYPDRLQYVAPGACEVVMKCHTDYPLQVIGIASSICLPEYAEVDTLRKPEYLRLYQVYPDDSLELKLQFQYHLDDPHRTINIWYKRIPNYDCDTLMLYKRYFPIYEYYAEKPVVITDSFYIGGTNYSLSEEFTSSFTNHPEYLAATWNVYYFPCPFPEVNYRVTNFYQTTSGVMPNTVINFTWREYMYTFPILLIDTSFADTGSTVFTCPEVQNFRVGSAWEDGGTLLWDAESPHSYWQLRLTQVGAGVDSPLVAATVSTTHFTFIGLESSQHYDVYIRALCIRDSDTLVSEWSAPIDLYTSPSSTLLDQPSNPFVQLLPNPATRSVQVLSSFALRSVEIYDLKGRRLLEQAAEGVSTVLDVTALPRGTYIVLVHNQQGVVTKRLILQ